MSNVRTRALQVPQVRTGNALVDDQNRRLAQAAKAAGGHALAEARLLTTDTDGTDGLAFTSGTARTVDHGLGRTIRGVLEVVRPSDTAATAPQVTAANNASTDLTKQVRLISANTGRCYLLVF